jgi:hypothetical protein
VQLGRVCCARCVRTESVGVVRCSMFNLAVRQASRLRHRARYAASGKAGLQRSDLSSINFMRPFRRSHTSRRSFHGPRPVA